MKIDPIMLAHKRALGEKSGSYHEFLIGYSKSDQVIYGFVEGKYDPSYYRGVIDRVIPEDWSVRLFPAGCKKQVYSIYRKLDWRIFKKRRICFFVDRDLSGIIPQKYPEDINIFVTPKYSIENHFDSRNTCDRILTEIFCLSSATNKELSEILDLYEKQRESFFIMMIPIMGRVLTWRMHETFNKVDFDLKLDELKMQKFFEFNQGVIIQRPLPDGHQTIDSFVHYLCSMDPDKIDDIQPALEVFSLKKNYRNFIRGKQLMWFILEFCKSIHADCVGLFSAIGEKPRPLVDLGLKNAVAVLGPRVVPPKSLSDFLKDNYAEYTTWHDARRWPS